MERVDIAFRVLCANHQPHFTTINEFRRRHRAALAGLFVQVLQLCQHAGLVKLGQVAVDGTKMQAKASKHKAMSYERMQAEEKRLQEEVERLLASADEIDPQEDALYGEGRHEFELPDELKCRESRLKKIRQAKAALHYCFACDADRCVSCVFTPLDHKEDAPGEERAPQCCACGNDVKVIRVHRRQLADYTSRVLDAPFFLFSKNGAVLLMVMGTIKWLLGIVPCTGWLFIWALTWEVFFGLVRQSAAGSDAVEMSSLSDFQSVLRVGAGARASPACSRRFIRVRAADGLLGAGGR